MRKKSIESIYDSEFQNIEGIKDLHRNEDKFDGIHIRFLEDLFGEEWEEVYLHGWNDKREFMQEYGDMYNEWKEFGK